jgi:hypothetical protein
MANTFAPFGFAESHRLGAAPDYQNSRRWINPANATPIYFGDPVSMVAGSGYIAQATPGTFQLAGIFAGCEYMSKSGKKMLWSPWWPGNTGDVYLSGTGLDVAAKITDDPLTVFRVQANGQLTIAMVGNNAQFAYGISNVPAPNQMSGIGNACLDVVTAPAATATFPFRIVDLIRDPTGVSGTDITAPYSWAFVTFNNQDYKALTGHG